VRVVDERGNYYGRLLILERAGNNKWGEATWFCHCDCGNFCTVIGKFLRKGHTRSCGCLRSEVARLRAELPYGEAALNRLYGNYCRRALVDEILWKLDKNQFRAITTRPCFYCGAEPTQRFNEDNYNGTYVYNGIDRINSDLGYVEGNVVPCCKQCNFAKRDLPVSEFIDWITAAYTHLAHLDPVVVDAMLAKGA